MIIPDEEYEFVKETLLDVMDDLSDMAEKGIIPEEPFLRGVLKSLSSKVGECLTYIQSGEDE